MLPAPMEQNRKSCMCQAAGSEVRRCQHQAGSAPQLANERQRQIGSRMVATVLPRLRWHCSHRATISAYLLLALAMLPGVADATCRLPIDFPVGSEPSGATQGPQNSLVAVSDSGTLLFINLDDLSVREDRTLNDKYRDTYGWFDLEGVAMTNPESTFVYLAMENKASILEYEWHTSHRIFRRFDLPGFERRGSHGMESLTWVPTDASRHQGYFYVGSQMTGHVFIYELPLLDDTGPVAMARLNSIWTPIKEETNVAGLSYSSGYVFVNYDDGHSNHVLIFPIMPNGLPGPLKEQYEVDVSDSEGISVRRTSLDSWEVFFSSDARQAIFAYSFRFITGFEQHSRCARSMNSVPKLGGPSSDAAILHHGHGGIGAVAMILLFWFTY